MKHTQKTKSAPLTAAVLNKLALSHLDQGNPAKAEKCWEQALKINPNCALSQYNYGIHLWKTAKIDDMEAVRRLATICAEDINYWYCLAKLHLARADAENVVKTVNEAIAIYGETDDLKKLLTEAQEMMKKGLDGKCITVLKGHTTTINSVFFCPDGEHVITGSWDRTIRKWNIASGEGNLLLRKSTDYPKCLSPDGKFAVMQSVNHSLKIWDIEADVPIITMNGHTDDVISACFSPDGQLIVTGSKDNSIKLWDATTGECKHTMTEHGKSIYSVLFSPDGAMVVAADKEYVKIYNVATGDLIRSFYGHWFYTSSACFHPGCKQVLSGGYDQLVILRDIETGKSILTMEGHTSCIRSVCLNPDGRLAVSGCEGSLVKVWDTCSGVCIRTLEGHEGAVVFFCFSPDGKFLLSGSYDDTAKIWQIPVVSAVEPLWNPVQSPETINDEHEQFCSTISEIDQLIENKNIPDALTKLNEIRKLKSFTSSDDYFEICRKLSAYCVSTQLNRYRLKRLRKSGYLWDFYWEKGNSRMLTCGSDVRDCKVTLSELETGEWSGTIEYDDGGVKAVCFSNDGKMALTGNENGPVRIWEIDTDDLLDELEYEDFIESMCCSPDDQLLLIGSYNKAVIYELATKKRVGILKHKETVSSVCFRPDGRQALTGGADNTVKLWDIATRKYIHIMKEHKNDVLSVCFSPDGLQALSGSKDNTAKLWDLSSGDCIQTFKGHTDEVVSVYFSPDGKLALTGSNDKTVKIWDVASGDCIYSFEGFMTKILKVSFSPDGRQFAAASWEEVHIYTLDYDLHFPGWTEWDERASPFLYAFKTLHPEWTEDDFNKILIPDLQNHGYGWLLPDGVRKKLMSM